MLDRRTVLGFAAGLMVALVVNFAWNDRWALREAAAQAQPGPAHAGRFQVSAWSRPAATAGNNSYGPEHGAYILDTREGKVWLVLGAAEPRYIGTAKEPK